MKRRSARHTSDEMDLHVVVEEGGPWLTIEAKGTWYGSLRSQTMVEPAFETVDEELKYRSSRPKLLVPPGSRVRVALERLLPRKQFQLDLEPVIADTQDEWLEAMLADRNGHARWIRCRGYGLVAWALAWSILDRTLRRIFGLFRAR